MSVFAAAAHRVLARRVPLVVPPRLHACAAVVPLGEVVPVGVAVVPVLEALDLVDGALGVGLQHLDLLLILLEGWVR